MITTTMIMMMMTVMMMTDNDHLGARLQKRKRGRKTTLSKEARRARWRGRWGMWQERNLAKKMIRNIIFRLMVTVRRMVTSQRNKKITR